MNRRNFITTAALAIPTIVMGLPMSLPTIPNSVKYKYNTYEYEWSWSEQMEILTNKFLSSQGIRTMDYCASVVDENGNIGGTVDDWLVSGKTEPFVVKMHVLDSLPIYKSLSDSRDIDLIPTVNEIKNKMEVVAQTIYLYNITEKVWIPFVRGLTKNRYNRIVGMMNVTTKEEAEEILRKYE
jgi:hypothetical protein